MYSWNHAEVAAQSRSCLDSVGARCEQAFTSLVCMYRVGGRSPGDSGFRLRGGHKASSERSSRQRGLRAASAQHSQSRQAARAGRPACQGSCQHQGTRARCGRAARERRSGQGWAAGVVGAPGIVACRLVIFFHSNQHSGMHAAAGVLPVRVAKAMFA